MIDPGCNASFIQYNYRKYKGKALLVLSNINNSKTRKEIQNEVDALHINRKFFEMILDRVALYFPIIEEVLNASGENILDKIKPGDRFFTPPEELNSSKKSKIMYTSKGKKSKS